MNYEIYFDRRQIFLMLKGQPVIILENVIELRVNTINLNKRIILSEAMT